MKYQLKSEINGRGLLETIYANRNLDKHTVNELLNANKESLNDPFEIFNMDKAVEMFKNSVNPRGYFAYLEYRDSDGYYDVGAELQNMLSGVVLKIDDH